MQEKLKKFINLAIANNQKKMLDRHVPTHWNSDLACLATHIEFEEPIRHLTNDPKLKGFALTETQWALAKKLVEVSAV